MVAGRLPFGNLIRIITKAIRWATIRPIQRFNVENRSKKYLGPDAKYFMPAPRAIGALSRPGNGPQQYPHLSEGGFMSLRQKRLEAFKRDTLLPTQVDQADQLDELKLIAKSYSTNEEDDSLVREAAMNLKVLKTIVTLPNLHRQIDGAKEKLRPESDSSDSAKLEQTNEPHRPLPKLTNLQLTEPGSVWQVAKVPEGRLDLNNFQEIMINKLADSEYWTPDVIAEKYKIKPEYADLLTKYISQFVFVVSPRMKNLLDYVARTDPVYQATKHIIYQVDYSLRTDSDRIFDSMFLPEEEELDERVKELLTLGGKKALKLEESETVKLEPLKAQVPRQPTPLRIQSINKSSNCDKTSVRSNS